ncbi:MAG: metallophosphoesterase [Candidatus Altiarchaeota archaeon]|nr:metallophosphoesterase [Candidatus Altiarchaeota archaeon]
MKILCIADIHGNREMLLELRKHADDNAFKHILILGDFPSYHSFRDSGKSLEEVRFVLDSFVDFDVLAIPGNCDQPAILDVFEEYGVNLHGKSVVFDNTTLLGFGGSSPTPFNSPFEMGEEVIYERLEGLLDGVTNDKVVVAVHNPPYNTRCDVRSSGEHVGSKAVRAVIEKFQPDALLCSHIHESGGSSDTIGKTRIANIGSLSNRRMGVLQLDDNVTIDLGVL